MQAFICTFNCGKVPPFDDQFFTSLSNEWPQEPCDLYVFGFQELSSILDGTTPYKIKAILNKITTKLTNTLEQKYNSLFQFSHISYFGTIGLIIISSHGDRISKIETSHGHPVGHLYTNLKGGIGTRITFDNTEITFVCMHLNAGERLDSMIRRNEDLYEILSSLQFTDNWCVHKPNTHCFILGDLNYRMTGGFNYASDDQRQPLTATSPSEPEPEPEPGAHLRDELTYLRRKSIILPHFDEPHISFNPTYKYNIGSNEYVKNRIPSYCDRILYVGYGPHEDNNLAYKIIKYNAIPQCKLSDHVPVYMIVEIPEETPESIVDSNGYLLDFNRSSPHKDHLFNNQYLNIFALRVSTITTGILRSLLFLIQTKTGNTILALIVGALLYRLKQWLS